MNTNTYVSYVSTEINGIAIWLNKQQLILTLITWNTNFLFWYLNVFIIIFI